jgi:transcriptional regulator with XRE-family HTH domain
MGIFGEKLRKLREASGLTQAQLAKQIKVSDTFISLLENGQKFPSIVTVVALAKALKYEQQELLDLLTRDKLAQHERKPLSYKPTIQDRSATRQDFMEALDAYPDYEHIILHGIHPIFQTLPERRREAFLTSLAHFIEAFAPALTDADLPLSSILPKRDA